MDCIYFFIKPPMQVLHTHLKRCLTEKRKYQRFNSLISDLVATVSNATKQMKIEVHFHWFSIQCKLRKQTYIQYLFNFLLPPFSLCLSQFLLLFYGYGIWFFMGMVFFYKQFLDGLLLVKVSPVRGIDNIFHWCQKKKI